MLSFLKLTKVNAFLYSYVCNIPCEVSNVSIVEPLTCLFYWEWDTNEHKEMMMDATYSQYL